MNKPTRDPCVTNLSLTILLQYIEHCELLGDADGTETYIYLCATEQTLGAHIDHFQAIVGEMMAGPQPASISNRVKCTGNAIVS